MSDLREALALVDRKAPALIGRNIDEEKFWGDHASLPVIRGTPNIGVERASTLILTSTPTLSRHKTIIKEVEEISQAIQQEERDSTGCDDLPSPNSESGNISASPGERMDNAVKQKETDLSRSSYKKACKKLGIFPISHVSQALGGTELIVRYRSLSSRETLAICRALLDNRTIVEINLDDNVIGAKGADYVALLLADNTRIRTCSLANSNLGSVGGEAICEALISNRHLTSLNLSGNGFLDNDGVHFARIFHVNKSLRDVNLSHNNFGDEAARELGPAIGANESIKLLDLSWNKIRQNGGVFIAEGLAENDSLCCLNLSMNGFSSVGARAIGQALMTNQTLVELDLTYNRIYDDGAASMAQGLNNNSCLKFLYLANNPLTTNAALVLLMGINGNEFSAMGILDMMNIFLSNEIINVLRVLEATKPTFQFQFAGVLGSSTLHGNAAKQGIRDCDPLIILMEFAAKKGLRVLEMFKQFDRDNSGSISRAEFVEAIEIFDIPLTFSQLDELMLQLDKNGNAEIDYGELLLGEKYFRKKMHKLKKKKTATKTAVKKD